MELFPLDTSLQTEMTLRGGGGGMLCRCHSEQSIEQRKQGRGEGRRCEEH